MAEYIERKALLGEIAKMTIIPNDLYEYGIMAGVGAVKKKVGAAPAADVEPVVHGRWEWFEEWSPSTPEHPRECDDCGWRCGRCKTALEDIVGGYWDNLYEEPELNYCPNCGARMDGE